MCRYEFIANQVGQTGETVRLNDSKLPAGWEKRAKLKTSGTKAGKWDVVLIGPDGRTFRSRQDVKQYILQHQPNFDLELFDFRLGEEFYRERGIEPPKRAKDDYVAPSMMKQLQQQVNNIKVEPTAGPSHHHTSPAAAAAR